MTNQIRYIQDEPADTFSQTLEFGQFRLNLRRYELRKDGQEIKLRPKEFQLLAFLALKAGETVAKDELMDLLWPNIFVQENGLTVLMAGLRKALGDSYKHPELILTIPGRGYRFVADVERSVDTASSSASQSSSLSSEVLAVTQLTYLGSDPRFEYLGIGLADVICERLSRIPNVIIRPTRTNHNDRSEDSSVAVLGLELGADAILTGSIQKEGNRFRISIRLIRTQAGLMVWADQFDEVAENIFDLEDRIALKVASALARELTDAESTRLRRRASMHPKAKHAYMRGRALLRERTHASLGAAIDCLLDAVRFDPAYCIAYSALADCYSLMPLYSFSIPLEYNNLAKTYARKAIEADFQSAAAYTSLGYAQFGSYAWKDAQKSFERALDLDINYAAAHHWYSVFLVATGEISRAIEHACFAVRLDPSSTNVQENLGHILYFCGETEEAAVQLSLTIDMAPEFSPAHCFLGLTYLAQGRNKDAIRACKEALRLNPRNPLNYAALVHCLVADGKAPEATKVFDRFMRRASDVYVPSDCVSLMHAALGNVDEAFAWLSRALAERAPWLMFSRVLPIWEPLRNDPRFDKVVSRIEPPGRKGATSERKASIVSTQGADVP